MDYNELMSICERKHIYLKDVAEQIGMSFTGFRRTMIEQTLKVKHVIPICEALGITVDEFFSKEKTGKYYNMCQVGCNNGTMNIASIDEVIDTLKKQLEEKDKQITELLKHLK